MALIHDVKGICDRLGSRGWRDLFLQLTNGQLDIVQSTPQALEAELRKVVSVDRNVTGFVDFHPRGDQAISPGQPARSLLMHGLSSPDVHPTPNAPEVSYPTLEELDSIENYVYSLVSNRSDLNDTVIAVLAYQYRVSNRTAHFKHADFVYSRTGIARVGTGKQNYSAKRRSFWALPKNGEKVPVLPARYGTFICRKGSAGIINAQVMGGQQVNDVFLLPIHKLFDGEECLDNKDISIEYLEFHRNEKLRKIHTLAPSSGGVAPVRGFDIDALPFVRDSNNGGNLVSIERAGSSALIVPSPGKNLTRTVIQRNTNVERNQIVHFQVPPATSFGSRTNRFVDSTMEIPGDNGARLAPEYVNIRHEVDPSTTATQQPTDLNQLDDIQYFQKLREGQYFAAHFTDDSCDGCIEGVVSGIESIDDSVPAFSLVTAPDFLPLVDQEVVSLESGIGNSAPLSHGRNPVNPSLPLPSDPTQFAFGTRETSMTAVLSHAAEGPPNMIPNRMNHMVSYLPDAASNVFAPGWDAAIGRDSVGEFLTSSGLGSPFPEDAKLCAAISSFWPTAAPDNARTFGNQNWLNQLPMIDEELGFHPAHPKVLDGSVSSFRGWDGEYGPFFQKVSNNTFVNYVAINRSDYIRNSLKGKLTVALTAEIQSQDLIHRHRALRRCESVMNSNRFSLVSFRVVPNWRVHLQTSTSLEGGGFLFEFAELTGVERPTAELERVQKRVVRKHICRYAENAVHYKKGATAFQSFPH